jgi:hypothetical protein
MTKPSVLGPDGPTPGSTTDVEPRPQASTPISDAVGPATPAAPAAEDQPAVEPPTVPPAAQPVDQPPTELGHQARPTPPPRRTIGGARPLVRPFVLTGGRTFSEVHLLPESVVQISARRETRPKSPPVPALIELCRSPRSITELATRLRLPVQVVKVLVGDLLAVGALVVDRGGIHDDDQPDLLLLQQVLEGLQEL